MKVSLFQLNSFQENAKTFNLLILSPGMWSEMINSWPSPACPCPASLWTTSLAPPPPCLPSCLSSTTPPSTPRCGTPPVRAASPPPSPPSTPSWGPVRRAAAVETPSLSSRLEEVSFRSQWWKLNVEGKTNKTECNVPPTFSLHR